jgi:hypothetical protein
MENKKVIIVQSNGFVLIGELTGEKDANRHLELTDASIIRRWGTTKGLGEIALNGVTPNTILDYEGVVFVNPAFIMRTIICAV